MIIKLCFKGTRVVTVAYAKGGPGRHVVNAGYLDCQVRHPKTYQTYGALVAHALLSLSGTVVDTYNILR